MKKNAYLLGAMLAIGLLLAGFWSIDNAREVVFEVRVTPAELKADRQDSALVEFTVTNPDGSPRAGDNVLILRIQGHGSTKVTRVKTDEHGKASFTYHSYQESSFTPAMVNQIQLSNVSVGRIVGVYKRHQVYIPVVPEEQSGDTDREESGQSSGHIQLK